MSTTLVTAVFYGDREGELGGRCWPEQYYFSSFQNVYNFGLPTVVYTTEEGEKKVRRLLNYLDSIGVENKWQIKVVELGDFKFKPQIADHRKRVWDYNVKEVKRKQAENPDEPGFFHARCEVLCHRKLYFLKEISELNPYDTDNFVWVDSGITHWGLNPWSKGGVEINNFFNKKHYYPYNKNNIFTPDVGKGINNLINEHGMISFKHGNLWYNVNLVEVCKNMLIKDYGFNPKEASLKKQLVGGVIGVKPGEFDKLLSFYEKALLALCETNPPKTDFFTEEIILSAYWKIRNHFTMDFTEWNHDIQGDPSYVDFGDNPDEAMLKKRFYSLWDDLKDFA